MHNNIRWLFNFLLISRNHFRKENMYNEVFKGSVDSKVRACCYDKMTGHLLIVKLSVRSALLSPAVAQESHLGVRYNHSKGRTEILYVFCPSRHQTGSMSNNCQAYNTLHCLYIHASSVRFFFFRRRRLVCSRGDTHRAQFSKCHHCKHAAIKTNASDCLKN